MCNRSPAGSDINGTGYLSDGPTALGTAGASAPSIYNIWGTYDNGTSTLRSGLYLDDAADILTIDGPVILNVTGTLRTNNGNRIAISSTGSLEIYFTGALTSVTALLVVGGHSESVLQWCQPRPEKGSACRNNPEQHRQYQLLSVTSDFHGLIYMPNAYVHMRNSGATHASTARYGAISAENIYFNHVATLHYDTALRTAGAIGTFHPRPLHHHRMARATDPAEKITLP